ncbi:3-phytase A [Lachnellula subtilissima]|uniref:Phytase A n=1 Tax=Lachnellula subtilissima TaxID=602034 RepID=A0A8H8S0F6_9HELO|nr:3-phytase A [Lachnellula subtilissima]
MAKTAPTGRHQQGLMAHKYETIPSTKHVENYCQTRTTLHVDEETPRILEGHPRKFQSQNRRIRGRLVIMSLGVMGILLFLHGAIAYVVPGVGWSHPTQSCDSVSDGYQCQPELSHYWGQYAPYFAVESEIATEVPDQCQVTFAQILSRHGAREPTSSKSTKYNETIANIHAHAKSYSKGYTFIKDYTYTLGADQLSVFGQQQMINSGEKYYYKYKSLAQHTTPFIRSSGQDRVIESAQNWTQGFHDARVDDLSESNDGYPYKIVVISEVAGSNNTLDHGLCTSFEDGFDSKIGDSAQQTWLDIFTPPITARLNRNLPGVNFTNTDTIYLMDLCPFNTVANPLGRISLFCSLFTLSEWHSYDYYQTLGKYYGYGWGNPLGPTQGVGFTNELIARLTATPVSDHTSTNSTLDSSPKTFPVGGTTSLYADFSHDNDMTAIFAALGLYNATRPLSNTTLQDTEQTKGYSAAWSVPFAARAYFEKMSCVGAKEEFIRVIVNDRVLPLEACGGDNLGRCTLSAFVDSLSFARQGGKWDQCFA